MEPETRNRQIVRRSCLVVPVNVPEYVERAHRRGADAIVLDLDDTIPMAEKARARRLARPAGMLAARGGADVLVRINHPWELAEADLEEVIWPGLSGISYPRPETPDQLQRVDETITRLEQQRGMPAGSVKISIAIETVAALFNARELAHASPRLISIAVGAEHLALDLGIEPSAEGTELLFGKLFLVLLAREAGLYPMGTMRGSADYRDRDGQVRATRLAHSVGYRGASCIHPAQVGPLNEGFSPTPDEV